jgi:hypothetical protein
MNVALFTELFKLDSRGISVEHDGNAYLGLSTLLLTFFCVGALGLALDVGWQDGGNEVPPEIFILVIKKTVTDANGCCT